MVQGLFTNLVLKKLGSIFRGSLHFNSVKKRLGTTLVHHRIIITTKIKIILLLLLLLSATCFLVVVFCLEVSESLPYTKGGDSAYIAKKKGNNNKKGHKFWHTKKRFSFEQFWKGHPYRYNYCHIDGICISTGIFWPFT